MKEIWKDIEGYEGLYQISNFGRVKSLARINTKGRNKDIIKKDSFDGKGYCKAILCKNGLKTYPKIHRLVAEAFIPNPNNLPQVNHKDENPLNNRVDNLEWCDNKYNINYKNRSLRMFLSKSLNYLKKDYPNEKELIDNLTQIRDKIDYL